MGVESSGAESFPALTAVRHTTGEPQRFSHVGFDLYDCIVDAYIIILAFFPNPLCALVWCGRSKLGIGCIVWFCVCLTSAGTWFIGSSLKLRWGLRSSGQALLWDRCASILANSC